MTEMAAGMPGPLSNTVSVSAASKRLLIIQTIIEKYPWVGMTKELVKMLLPEKMIWSWSKRSWERHARGTRQIMKNIASFLTEPASEGTIQIKYTQTEMEAGHNGIMCLQS